MNRAAPMLAERPEANPAAESGIAEAKENGPGIRPLRVGVLVDLPLDRHAGGHVKFWRRIGAVAAGRQGLSLTLHFQGGTRERQRIAPNVDYVLEPPRFSSARLHFIAYAPDDADLGLWHPRLAAMLPHYDVIHTTDAYFAYARTARRVAKSRGIALVNSVHTNTPPLARLYTRATIERLFGSGLIGSLLEERLDLPGRLERALARQLDAHNRACDFVFVSRPEQLAGALAATGGHAGLLRRGIDRDLYHPAKRNRAMLAREFAIPPERLLVLFVGRVNPGKNVMLLADALRPLLAAGVDLHLLCCGEGSLARRVEAALPGRASCPGGIAFDRLAAIYAGADIFALPSQVEEYANVVPEALASGLPVLVATESGMGRVVVEGETGFVLPGQDAAAWTRAITALAGSPERRLAMGAAARRYAEAKFPSWEDLLLDDLLLVWRAAAAAHAAAGRRPAAVRTPFTLEPLPSATRIAGNEQ